MGPYLCDGEVVLEVGAIGMKLRSARIVMFSDRSGFCLNVDFQRCSRDD